MNAPGSVVVKVGGSLYDLPDLGAKLRRWLDELGTRELVLVPGGGSMANVVREFDRRHALGEEAAHWLALRVLTLNAWFLQALISQTAVVERLEECPTVWVRKETPILDGHAFARADEVQSGWLPHRWEVTSDSLAARIAIVLGAQELILLKSTRIPEDMDWEDAGSRGLVDPHFATLVRGASLRVRAVNFRT